MDRIAMQCDKNQNNLLGRYGIDDNNKLCTDVVNLAQKSTYAWLKVSFINYFMQYGLPLKALRKRTNFLEQKIYTYISQTITIISLGL